MGTIDNPLNMPCIPVLPRDRRTVRILEGASLATVDIGVNCVNA